MEAITATPYKPLVWICTPLRHFDHNGPMTPEAFEGLSEHYKEPIRALSNHPNLPWRFEISITGGGGVARARNRFVSEFIERGGSPDDRLFFVDYDLMPTAQDYVDVLARNLAIVGGLYTTRAAKGRWVINKMPCAAPCANGVLQVMELGTGFKCYKREVFTKTLEDNPWLNCDSDFDHSKRELGFFSMGPVHDKKLWPGRHRWLTEDYWLDWLTRESGFPTFVDTRIKLRHKDDFTGRIFPDVFPPDPGDLPAEASEP